MANPDALIELRPELDRLVDRHLSTQDEWFPHEMVPWELGRNFTPGVEDWDPTKYAVSDGVRSSLFVNLLTEDNLPYYTTSISTLFNSDGWREWTNRWTAEEQRHSHVIRGYFTVTEALDPWELERARMAQVSGGETPNPGNIFDGFAYLCMQELATRIAHRNTGTRLQDKAGYDIMARVAKDENLHFLFYRDLATAALQLDPSAMMLAIDRQVAEFEMPGTGIPGFKAHASAIAKEGIYDFSLHHDKILQPVVMRHWDIANLEGLSDEAEVARAHCIKNIERIGRVAAKLVARRERHEAADRELAGV